ncbi:solute carrier family 2, facilitated glucose transporter member 7-like, partial [Petaurus breviceps papuanus]|uniref:solute carrier family 2, facilitated glucose transporter member 7-like n=1 Tax=Petaurus breviceps papuanus TaxID=3040969 RepID=UPI0036D9F9B3
HRDPLEKSKGRLTPVLALATLSAAFGSAFQYGYNISVVNTPHKVLKSFYNETYFDRYGKFMDDSLLLILWSVTVSMFPLGGLIGALIVGFLVDRYGRKRTLLINNILAITSAILMGSSKAAKSYEMIIFSRVIVGICAGWPMLLAITGIPAVLQLLSLPFFPESPRYTLIQKGDEGQARKALRELRGWDNVEDEIEEMHLEDRAEKAEGRLSVINLFTFKPLRWQLISVIVLMAGQQLSGINAINYYADMIYATAGVNPMHSQYVTVGAGILNIVMTVISAFIVELLGRRLLLLVGYGICGSACVVLTLALIFQNKVQELSYLSIICVFSYIAGHSTGPSPVPSVVRTEIFLQSSRPAAFMVDGAVHWLTNFIIGLVFPSIQEGIGAYSFIIFAVICLFTAIYIYVVIPETKGKTFVEINQTFAKRNKVVIPEKKKEETMDFSPCPHATSAKETHF